MDQSARDEIVQYVDRRPIFIPTPVDRSKLPCYPMISSITRSGQYVLCVGSPNISQTVVLVTSCQKVLLGPAKGVLQRSQLCLPENSTTTDTNISRQEEDKSLVETVVQLA